MEMEALAHCGAGMPCPSPSYVLLCIYSAGLSNILLTGQVCIITSSRREVFARLLLLVSLPGRSLSVRLLFFGWTTFPAYQNMFACAAIDNLFIKIRASLRVLVKDSGV